MKTLSIFTAAAVAASALFASLASAQGIPATDPTILAKVPTGYQVPGTTYFVMKDGKDVAQVGDRTTLKEIERAMKEPGHPYSFSSGSGSGSTASSNE